MIFAAVLSVSIAVTGVIVAFAKRLAVQDIPNSRSLHRVPTPRGGGLAIVLAFALGFILLLLKTGAPVPREFWGFGAAAIALAALGWVDDRRSLGATFRLAVQVAVSVAFVAMLHSPEAPVGLSDLGCISRGMFPLAAAIAVFGCVWSVNIYNFMDGTDGIAAAEAVLAAVAWGAIAWKGGEDLLAAIAWVLAAASAGFLVFNRPPARIFMGDVASGFIGFCFAGLFVMADVRGTVPLSAGLVLLGVFVVDTTRTLWVRWRRGENLAQAHRDHAYQHACLSGLGHRGVLLGTVLIDVFWLVPLAVASTRFPSLRWALLFVAYAPLWFLAIRFNAGKRREK